jgi:hypothetical protein
MTDSPTTPRLAYADSAVLCEAVHGEVEALRRFIDRRFDELSVEVLGAVQMVDFSEADLSGPPDDSHGQAASLVAAPAIAARDGGPRDAGSLHGLTGQRERRAIDQLRRVETLLEVLMSKVPAAAAPPPATAAGGGELAQRDIDRLSG